jgi:hypothetical protein
MNRPHAINIVIGLGIFAFIAISLYWITWFLTPKLVQSRTPDHLDYACYVTFEQSFPLADVYVAIAALLGAIGLLKMRSWGFLSMMLAAGGAIFLGLMDLLYDLEHVIFIPLSAESVTELLIVILLLSLGPVLVTLLWKKRRLFL